MRFVCEACDQPTDVPHFGEVVLCPDCRIEAMLSDAADAVAKAGESIDVEYAALCASYVGHPNHQEQS